MHLSRGERSILDAFHSAAKQIAAQQVGTLVPLYRFYPSIESFLDTAVKRTIDQAAGNESLEPFDIELLKVLFLIRYVDEIKGNVNNLVTLCIDEIDADRLTLRFSTAVHRENIREKCSVLLGYWSDFDWMRLMLPEPDPLYPDEKRNDFGLKS